MMKIKLIFILVLFSFVFMEDAVNSKDSTLYADSKAPLIISTLPYVNQDPTAVAAFITLLLSASETESLPTKKNDPNIAMFLGSIPLFSTALNSNEILLLPSFGQMYNNKIGKSFILSSFKSYWLTQYKKSKDINIKDRNRSLWWLLILTLYGMADAYVDAQFAQKDEIGNINYKREDR